MSAISDILAAPLPINGTFACSPCVHRSDGFCKPHRRECSSAFDACQAFETFALASPCRFRVSSRPRVPLASRLAAHIFLPIFSTYAITQVNSEHTRNCKEHKNTENYTRKQLNRQSPHTEKKYYEIANDVSPAAIPKVVQVNFSALEQAIRTTDVHGFLVRFFR